ncbi:MAG: hypothetical protein PHT99_08365, partial [Methanoregula sp.]|nr:hypothetical protein [Methanoregula sp.]
MRFTSPVGGTGVKYTGSVTTTCAVGPDGRPGAATYPASGNVTFSPSRSMPGCLTRSSGPGRTGFSVTIGLLYIDISRGVTHSSKVSSQFVFSPPAETTG